MHLKGGLLINLDQIKATVQYSNLVLLRNYCTILGAFLHSPDESFVKLHLTQIKLRLSGAWAVKNAPLIQVAYA